MSWCERYQGGREHEKPMMVGAQCSAARVSVMLREGYGSDVVFSGPHALVGCAQCKSFNPSFRTAGS